MSEEMKVADVRNWVLNNRFNSGNPSEHDVRFADMLKEKFSVGPVGSQRTLDGAWLQTWEIEKLFNTFFEDGEPGFQAMKCDVMIYQTCK
jgi:hypothetical protein